MADVFTRVVDELKEESDRGAVILAFAWMDEQMTQNLMHFCLPPTRPGAKKDDLFGTAGTIGDASIKIDLSLRLGLMRPRTSQSLHLFRKLRNDFAHLSSKLTFESPLVRSRVLALFDNEEDT